MKHTAAYLTILLLAAAGVEAEPLKVFILAGQSNMEGTANIGTNPHFPAYRSGHRLFQRPSPSKQFPSNNPLEIF